MENKFIPTRIRTQSGALIIRISLSRWEILCPKGRHVLGSIQGTERDAIKHANDITR